MTRVKFLIHPEDETQTVFAVFPQIAFGNNKRVSKQETVLCYEHIGQHSECSIEYARECYEATAEQYEALCHELTSLVGYNLLVLNKSKIKL
jgi:hypothetical protein